MITFKRYPHINDLIKHYLKSLNRHDVLTLIETEINSKKDAELFSRFIWDMVEAINEDEENKVSVLGSVDNTEMLPDLSYEVSKLMKDTGFYDTWVTVSNEEL